MHALKLVPFATKGITEITEPQYPQIMRLNYLYCFQHQLRTQRDFCKDRQKTRSNSLSIYKKISIGILTMLS